MGVADGGLGGRGKVLYVLGLRVGKVGCCCVV